MTRHADYDEHGGYKRCKFGSPLLNCELTSQRSAVVLRALKCPSTLSKKEVKYKIRISVYRHQHVHILTACIEVVTRKSVDIYDSGANALVTRPKDTD